MAFVVENLLHMELLPSDGDNGHGHGQGLSSNNEHSYNSDSSSSERDSESGEHDTTEDYPGILDSQLTALTPTEHTVFTTLVATLFVLSLSGNIGTLHVNVRRKMRPFFRACLISLALGDLLNTVFLTVAYLAQFSAEYLQIWRIGTELCDLVPFATTAAILASSMTLVCIALDRYFAMMRATIGFWNPGALFCVVCMGAIWAVSIAISSPVIWIYVTMQVYILSAIGAENSLPTTPHHIMVGVRKPTMPDSTTIGGGEDLEANARTTDFPYTPFKKERLIMMCVSAQENATMYYVIVFAIIFIPCIVAFIWLNSIIARKIWQRRHTASGAPCIHMQAQAAAKAKKRPPANGKTSRLSTVSAPTCNCRQRGAQSTSLTMPSSMVKALDAAPPPHNVPNSLPQSAVASTTKAPPPPPPLAASASSTRESRHIRMFTIVILMMAVFIFFRLPAWIFLIMRTYGSYSKPIHWIIHFSFGVLNLTSCVLNPLFYTFLAETIQCALYVKVKLCDDVCGLRPCCRRHRTNSAGDVVPTETVAGVVNCWRRVWALLCCGGRWTIGQHIDKEVTRQTPSMALVMGIKKKTLATTLNTDKDEGVDVSDEDASSCGDRCREINNDNQDLYDYSQRIYTIFPPSMVSSSLASQ